MYYFMFCKGKEFQGNKMKVALARKKAPASMRGGLLPRDGRGGQPPLLRGGRKCSYVSKGLAYF